MVHALISPSLFLYSQKAAGVRKREVCSYILSNGVSCSRRLMLLTTSSVFVFSWGMVQPDILSVPELCHHVAEAWVSTTVLASGVLQYKHQNPGTVRSTRRSQTGVLKIKKRLKV